MSPRDLVARHGGVEISGEVWEGAGSTVVLIAGLGEQRLWWPAGFVHALTVAGHRVVRFDNRDSGRSSTMTGTAAPGRVRRALAAGRPPEVPYRLDDLAADTLAVLDAAGAESAHLVGASMGARIAQEAALAAPGRVRSLTSIMAGTGDPAVDAPTGAAWRALHRAPPHDEAEAVTARVEMRRILAGTAGIDPGEERARALEERVRRVDPAGAGRQLSAVEAAGDRTAALAGIAVPTLVVHGDADPLVDVGAGRATAGAIPGAEYLEVPGMGHELAERHQPVVLQALLRLVARSGG